MNKRELRSIEILKLENTNQVEFKKGTEFNIIPKIKGDILILNIFDKEDIEKGELTPGQIIFQTKDDYITQEFSYTVKWLTGDFHSILGVWKYSCTLLKYAYISPKNIETINSWFDELGIKVNEDPYVNLDALQRTIRNKRLELKHKKITDRIDETMESVEDLPNDFEEWIDKEAFKFSQYIYYEYKPKKKMKGYCTHCKSEVEVESPKHNKQGICPKCKCNIRYKAKGKSRNIYDETHLSIIQKVNNEVLVRYFYAKKSYYEHYEHPIFEYNELSRVFISKDTVKEYEYADFKQTGHIRWCDSIGRYYIEESSLYFNNLEFLKDTEYKYSAIELLAKETIFNVVNYLIEYKNNKFLEYLVKLKLYNIAADYVCASCYLICNDLNENGKNILEVLGVDKVTMKRLQELNPSMKGYRIIKYCFENKIKLSDEEYTKIITKRIHHWGRLFEVSKTINKQVNKIINYIEGLTGKFDDNLLDYSDYISNGKKLKYDLKKDMVLFPKNFIEAHDLATDLIMKNQSKEEYANFVEHYKNLKDKYEFETEKYIIVKPKSPMDLIKEGQALGHCVGSYVKIVARGKTTILFVREKENIKKPFYTLEIINDKVQQCRTKGNISYTENKEVKKFVDKLVNNIKSKQDKKNKKLKIAV